MYVNPLIAGVFLTLFVEMVFYICRDVSRKNYNKRNNKRHKEDIYNG